MAAIGLELRFASRSFARSPVFTGVAIAALAVGIGVNVTLFGFVNALVLRPLDVPEPERLVRTDSGAPEIMRLLSESDYLEYRDRNRAFESLAMFHHGWMTAVRIEDTTRMIAVSPVSGNYFETLGVVAAEGRLIATSDDAPEAPSVVVLSAEGRRRFFDGDPDVVGTVILVDRQPFTVVGVTPESFLGTTRPGVPQIYSTFRPTRARRADPPGHFIGRLRSGVTRLEAEADLKRIAVQLGEESGAKRSITTYPGTAATPQVVDLLAPLGALVGLVALAVLWIACSNVAMLLLARAASRRKEIGLRLAIGASRRDVLRQLLVESLLLSTLAGSGASVAAHLASQVLSKVYLPVPMPIVASYQLDARVIGFAFGLSFLTTFLFGLAPAREALRTDVVSAVKAGDHASAVGRSRTSFQLVVTQVALSTALLAMTGIMVRSVIRPPDLKVDVEGVLTAVARLPQSARTAEERAALVERVLKRLESAPGITSATAVRHVPQTRNQGEHHPVDIFPSELERMEPDAPRPIVYDNRVSRGHFETLGIELLAGRDFDIRDGPSRPPVAIVNESYVERFWPGEDPVGKLLVDGAGETLTVIGLARDSKYTSRDEPPTPFVYRPFSRAPIDSPTFLLKSTLGVAETAELVRARISLVDPDVAVYNVRALDERLTPGAHVALAWLTGVLGLFGALLGGLGTYGLVSWAVHERRREFGVRVALGGSRASIVRLTTREGVRWAAVGVGLGLAGFLIGARFLTSLLGGVSPYDPVTLGSVATAASGDHLCFVLAAGIQAGAHPGCRRASVLDA